MVLSELHPLPPSMRQFAAHPLSYQSVQRGLAAVARITTTTATGAATGNGGGGSGGGSGVDALVLPASGFSAAQVVLRNFTN